MSLNYTYTSAAASNKILYDLELSQDTGLISTTGTAKPSTTLTMTGTAGFGGTYAFGTTSNTWAAQYDIIMVPGAGSAGANYWATILALGTSGNNFIVDQYNAPSTIVTGVTITSHYRVDTTWMPTYVFLTNITTGYNYKWVRGMANNTCIVTTPAGATSLQTTTGIVVNACGFNFDPSFLNAANTEQMIYEVKF